MKANEAATKVSGAPMLKLPNMMSDAQIFQRTQFDKSENNKNVLGQWDIGSTSLDVLVLPCSKFRLWVWEISLKIDHSFSSAIFYQLTSLGPHFYWCTLDPNKVVFDAAAKRTQFFERPF